MRDCLGNKLEVGNLVYWHLKQCIGKVIRIDEPQLTPDALPTVTIEIQIETLPNERGACAREPQCGSIMRVVDPSSEALLDQISGGGSRPS